MAAITPTTRPAAPTRPSQAPQRPGTPDAQKLQMAHDRFTTTRQRAQRNIEDGFGEGVNCSRAAVRGGSFIGRAFGSLAGAGGKDQAPAVVGELAATVVSAPVCFAGAVGNSFVQQGVMAAAEMKYKQAERQYGH